jgi:SAM-dependent methyltransferase
MTDKKNVSDYLKLYQDIHEGGDFLIGSKKFQNANSIFDGSNFYEKLWDDFKIWADGRPAFRVLDFGCGKAKHLYEPHLEGKTFHQYFKGACQEYYLYDPGFRKYQTAPVDTAQFDAVICADVMEHIPDEAVDETLARIRKWADPNATCFFSISGMAAKKCFVDGENLHCNVQPIEYWVAKLKQLNRRFIMAYTDINGTTLFKRV